jgi:hypothetical protein
LAVNLKKGMVFSPFFHYGMYSAPQQALRVYDVNVVTLNGDTLRGKNFSPQQWDKIHVTLQAVLASSCDSSFYTTQVQRLYAKAKILPSPYAVNFVNEGSRNEKLTRFKAWLGKQLGEPGADIEVQQAGYRYQKARLDYEGPLDIMTQNIPCY